MSKSAALVFWVLGAVALVGVFVYFFVTKMQASSDGSDGSSAGSKNQTLSSIWDFVFKGEDDAGLAKNVSSFFKNLFGSKK